MIPTYFSNYGIVIVEFLIELYVFYFLVMRKLKRKSHFYLRAILGLVAVFILAFPIAILYTYIGTSAFGRILVYLILFGFSVAHCYICFEESIWTIILSSVFAYTLQNLVYKFFLTIWVILLWFKLTNGWSDLFGVYYRIIYYSCFVGSVIGLEFLFIKRIAHGLSGKKLNMQLLGISLGVLLITVILCSAEDVYFIPLSNGTENSYNDVNTMLLRETGNIFSIVCCSLVGFLISQSVKNDSLKQEVMVLQATINQAGKQYEITKETIDLINIKCHDIRYKVQSSLENKEENYIEDINKTIAIYDSNVETGNKLIDVLFTQKSLYCEQKGIQFSPMIDGTKLSFIQDGDLYCLFGNIIDNAIEAVTNIPEDDKRIINFVVKSKGDMVIIQTDNYYLGEVKFDAEGLPITTKKDKKNHGFGTKSIRLLVDKYGGTMTTYTENNIFHLNILFNPENITK